MIDDRGRAEARLLHAEARRVADTQQALSELLAGFASVPVRDRPPRPDRRSRWLLVVAAAVVFLVAAAALVVLRRGSPDSPAVDTPVVTSTSTATTTPATTLPPTTVPTTTPPASTAPTTITAPATPAPSSLAPVVVTPITDVFVTVSDETTSIIDVRDADGLVGSYDLGCPPDRDCLVQSARVMGDTIWVAITESALGDPNTVLGARVVSVTRSTGGIATHLVLDGTTQVSSAGLGADGTLYAYVDANVPEAPPERDLVAIEDGATRRLASGLSGFRLSDDGRYLAVSFASPMTGAQPRFEITDLVDHTTATFQTDGVFDGPSEWSPDGRHLLVNDQWEDGNSWIVDPWSGTGSAPRGGEPYLYEACFLDDQMVAQSTWTVGYGQGDAVFGMVRFTDVRTGSTVGELGEQLFGVGLRCHPDGSVTYLRQPVVDVELSPGFSQPEPDWGAPLDLVHIAPDGTMTVRESGHLRMV